MGRTLLSHIGNAHLVSNADIANAMSVLSLAMKGSRRGEVVKRMKELNGKVQAATCEAGTQTIPQGRMVSSTGGKLGEEDDLKLWVTGPARCLNCGRDSSCSCCSTARSMSVQLQSESLKTLERAFSTHETLRRRIARDQIRLVFARQLLKRHDSYYAREREEKCRYSIQRKQAEIIQIADLLKSRLPSPPYPPLVSVPPHGLGSSAKPSFVMDMLTRHQKFLAPLLNAPPVAESPAKPINNKNSFCQGNRPSVAAATLGLQTADAVCSW